MPQALGGSTWLVNTRQDSTTVKWLQLFDNMGRANAENERLEADVSDKLRTIDVKLRRAVSTIDGRIRDARVDLRRQKQLQRLVNGNGTRDIPSQNSGGNCRETGGESMSTSDIVAAVNRMSYVDHINIPSATIRQQRPFSAFAERAADISAGWLAVEHALPVRTRVRSAMPALMRHTSSNWWVWIN